MFGGIFMPEIVNVPQPVSNSEVMNRIELPKENSSQLDSILRQTKDIQKTVDKVSDSEDKKRKSTKKWRQKD